MLYNRKIWRSSSAVCRRHSQSIKKPLPGNTPAYHVRREEEKQRHGSPVKPALFDIPIRRKGVLVAHLTAGTWKKEKRGEECCGW